MSLKSRTTRFKHARRYRESVLSAARRRLSIAFMAPLSTTRQPVVDNRTAPPPRRT
jgi:hypothetical protein